MNQLIQMLMNQLKMRNPQMLQQYQELQKNQGNPQEFLTGLMSNYSPEQVERFRSYVRGFGFTDEQLNKYGINSKKS